MLYRHAYLFMPKNQPEVWENLSMVIYFKYLTKCSAYSEIYLHPRSVHLNVKIFSCFWHYNPKCLDSGL